MDRKKLIIFAIVGFSALIVLVIFLATAFSGGGTKKAANATLQFWGTFDEPEYFTTAIREYRKTNPNITIIYRKIPYGEYEKTLLDSFAAGTGPDIWLMHNTWLPKHLDKIAPLDQRGKTPIFTYKDFRDKFVDVTVTDLTRGTDIYALPLYVDTLALYYNKDLLNKAGISAPPRTWEDFVQQASLLTAKDERGNITKSAAAIGTAQNVNRSTDLLALLMLQSGVLMTDKDNTSATFAKQVEGISVGEIATQFYTDFANQSKPDRYTWNDQQKYSIDAFADGNTAMMFNYSHHITTLREKAPRLNFDIAPIPQPGGAQISVTYANYWAPTVAKQSKNTLEAWKFLVYLSTTDATVNYLNTSLRPAARRDLIELQRADADIGVYAVQALAARSWYQVDSTAIETIFAKLIDDINFNRTNIHDGLKAAENQVNVIMSKGHQ